MIAREIHELQAVPWTSEIRRGRKQMAGTRHEELHQTPRKIPSAKKKTKTKQVFVSTPKFTSMHQVVFVFLISVGFK